MDRKGLGKGLSALIPGSGTPATGVKEIELSAISFNPYQPRKNLDEGSIAELAASIREHGVIQPIVVRSAGAGRYELVAGERRLRAARSAGLTSIPVILREMADQESLEVALIENIQREDISPLDAARAYRRLMDEFDLSQEDVAARVGKSRSAVANTLRLLQLPEAIQARVEKGEMTEGHARALLSIVSPAGQALVADEIVRKQCSVREAERLARSWASSLAGRNVSRETNSLPGVEPNLKAVEDQLRQILKTRVRIRFGEDRGTIEIEFYGQDDLDRLLTLLADNYLPAR
ncbi:MAG: ParB/RepB/Spo0J family partition protein [Armatimonadetes bacterium]|nr:ParB/RepB/Spo0J family partition protein [Armatimonadota bacterium]